MGAATGFMGTGALLVVDDTFAPACVRPTVQLPGIGGAFWVNASLRVDGELEQRIADRARAAHVDRAPTERGLLAALAEDEPSVRARLQVLAGVEDLFAAGTAGLAASDPRLADMVSLSRAVRGAFGPGTTALGDGELRSLPRRVVATRNQPRESSAELQAAWQLVNAQGAMPLVDLHVALLTIRASAELIAEHAEIRLARTLDVQMAARYRRLAEGCRAVLAAAAEVLGPG